MSDPKGALWLPQAIQDTNIAKFMSFVNRHAGLNLKTYEDIYQWSIRPSSIGKFWAYAYQFLVLGNNGNIAPEVTVKDETVSFLHSNYNYCHELLTDGASSN